MKAFTFKLAAVHAGNAVLQACLAQSTTPTLYRDPSTGIRFDTWTVPNSSVSAGLTFGVAFPEDALTTDATEFIGYLSCNSANGDGSGWCGISLGGYMYNSLLLMAYPSGEGQGDKVLTSFRFTSEYAMPSLYTGNATLTQISSTINSTGFSLLFRCEGCLSWNQDGTAGNASTSSGRPLLGWAQAGVNPMDGECPNDLSLVKHDAQSLWYAQLDKNSTSPLYDSWSRLATKVVTGDCDDDAASTMFRRY